MDTDHTSSWPGTTPASRQRKLAMRRRCDGCSAVCTASTNARLPSSVASASTLPGPMGGGSGVQEMSMIFPSRAALLGVKGLYQTRHNFTTCPTFCFNQSPSQYGHPQPSKPSSKTKVRSKSAAFSGYTLAYYNPFISSYKALWAVTQSGHVFATPKAVF